MRTRDFIVIEKSSIVKRMEERREEKEWKSHTEKGERERKREKEGEQLKHFCTSKIVMSHTRA